MKKVGIVTDSHSGITQKEAQEKGIHVIAMPFYVDGTCFYEEKDMTREEFYNKLREGVNVSTSQPGPAEVTDVWDELLKEYETLVYIPISSGLSGSFNTAWAMSQEEEYEGKVFVVDSGRVSSPLHRMVLDAVELVEEGLSAAEIKEILDASRADMVIYVGLSTLEYLKKGGRVKPAAAAVAGLLNIKPVMMFDVGILDVHKKCRGMNKAKQAMIEAMKNEFETRFKEQVERGDMYLVAASSSTPEVTEEWVKQIEAAFPGMEVLCDDLALAVSCHIGHDALGIGCSCKPRR